MSVLQTNVSSVIGDFTVDWNKLRQDRQALAKARKSGSEDQIEKIQERIKADWKELIGDKSKVLSTLKQDYQTLQKDWTAYKAAAKSGANDTIQSAEKELETAWHNLQSDVNALPVTFRFKTDLTAIGKDFEALKAALKSGDTAQIQKAETKLQVAWNDLQSDVTSKIRSLQSDPSRNANNNSPSPGANASNASSLNVNTNNYSSPGVNANNASSLNVNANNSPSPNANTNSPLRIDVEA